MRPGVVGVVALLLGVLFACGEDGTVISGTESQALEQQRDDVRALAVTLTDGARGAVAAEVLTSDGDWEGCTSAFPETYRDYRYRATVRLSASSRDGDLLQPLRPVIDDAGLATSGQDDPAKLRAGRDGIETSFWQLPPATADAGQGDLLLTVIGPCIEVPEDQRDAWRDKRESEPELF